MVSLVIMSTKDVAIAVRSVAWWVKGRVKEKQNRKRRSYRKRMMFDICYRQETDQGIMAFGRWLDPKNPPTVLVCIFHSSSGATTQAPPKDDN